MRLGPIFYSSGKYCSLSLPLTVILPLSIIFSIFWGAVLAKTYSNN